MLRRALFLTVLALVAIQAGPAQARSCSVRGEERELGATYVTTLSAKGTSCGSAKGVVRAYHSCRGSGKTCGRKVNGYKCNQKILQTSPVQYDAKVTCKKGGAKVKFTYSQNT